MGRLNNENLVHDNSKLVTKVLTDPSFERFAKEAYRNKNGYSIRFNSTTGQKEMFIAGTRSGGDWALNIWDTIMHGSENLVAGVLDEAWEDVTDLPATLRPNVTKLNPFRVYHVNNMESVAARNNVDVIYGHSRGGAILSDMRVKDTTLKVGLDAAMFISSDKNLINFKENAIFDNLIGLTGKRNITKNYGNTFHHSWN